MDPEEGRLDTRRLQEVGPGVGLRHPEPNPALHEHIAREGTRGEGLREWRSTSLWAGDLRIVHEFYYNELAKWSRNDLNLTSLS